MKEPKPSPRSVFGDQDEQLDLELDKGQGDASLSRSSLRLWGGVAVVLIFALAAGIGWHLHRAGQVDALMREVSASIDRGDFVAAGKGLEAAEALDDTHPELAWMRGRLAYARADMELAAVQLGETWKRAGEERWSSGKRALVALELVAALSARGEDDKALEINDQALAQVLELLDTHLDREDLGPGGVPLAGSLEPVSAGVRAAIGLLEQRGTLAASRAEGLFQQGERDAADRVMALAERRISGSVCTDTHRLYCRGVRRSLRELAMTPIVGARVHEKINRALGLVRAGQYEEALEVAQEAREALKEGEGEADRDKGAAREAAEVAYAVRVAWGAELEKKRAWKEAQEQYAQAAALQVKAGLKETRHRAGLERTEAVVGLLDDTSNFFDKFVGIGMGDRERKRLHERLEVDPLNPKLYAEEAMIDVRAAHRLPELEQRKELGERAQRYLKVGEKVAPKSGMARFYQGVTRFLAGYPREGLEVMQRSYEGGYRDRAAELYLGESLGLRGHLKRAATHWRRAWQARKTDTWVARRAVEALLASDDLKGARALLKSALEERSVDQNLIEAQVMVHFYAHEDDALRQMLALDVWRFSTDDPEPVRRARRIGEAVYNKLGARVRGEVLGEGEELIDRIYGYAIPADAQGLILGKRVQSALLVLGTQGMTVLRWDATRDYAEELKKGVSLARRAARLGLTLGGEWSGLNLGGGIEKLAQVLDLLPAAEQRGEGKKGQRENSADLIIDSLQMIETLRRDVELGISADKVRIFRVEPGEILSYDLVPVRPDEGLYALMARTRDGRSLWHTDSERLFVYTTRPGRIRMFMARYLSLP